MFSCMEIGEIVMKRIELSEEEKREFIDYMLRNEELEKTIQNRNKALPFMKYLY